MTVFCTNQTGINFDLSTGLKDYVCFCEIDILPFFFFLCLFHNRTIGGSSEALGKLTEADLKFLFVT